MDEVFTIEDNSIKVLKEFDERILTALYLMGLKSVEHIVKYMSTPDASGHDIVDTGRLRASISFITPDRESGWIETRTSTNEESNLISGRADKNTVVIGSNVEYASFVNNGTSKQAARHFMENGINRAKPEIEELLVKLFKGE